MKLSQTKKNKIELICDCGRVNAAKGKPCTCKKKNEKNASNLEKRIVDDINNNTEYGAMIKNKIQLVMRLIIRR